jgi:hypothetical protein
MNIPEKVAIQGIESIEKYKDYQNRIEQAKENVRMYAKDIREIEEKIIKVLQNHKWLSVSSYRKDKESILLDSYSLIELSKEHREASIEHQMNDNIQLSLRREMYERGWLSDWEQDEWRRFG